MKTSLWYLALFCASSIYQIADSAAVCAYYPAYPSSKTTYVTVLCSYACCLTDYPTTAADACCTSTTLYSKNSTTTAYDNTWWQVFVPFEILNLVLIGGIIFVLVYFYCKQKKRYNPESVSPEDPVIQNNYSNNNSNNDDDNITKKPLQANFAQTYPIRTVTPSNPKITPVEAEKSNTSLRATLVNEKEKKDEKEHQTKVAPLPPLNKN